MARPTFTVEGIANGEAVSVTFQSISPEVALNEGRRRLTDEHGKVRKVTVRYTESTSDLRLGASDFIDPNRTEDDG